jgi:hypothetical protein
MVELLRVPVPKLTGHSRAATRQSLPRTWELTAKAHVRGAARSLQLRDVDWKQRHIESNPGRQAASTPWLLHGRGPTATGMSLGYELASTPLSTMRPDLATMKWDNGLFPAYTCVLI